MADAGSIRHSEGHRETTRGRAPGHGDRLKTYPVRPPGPRKPVLKTSPLVTDVPAGWGPSTPTLVPERPVRRPFPSRGVRPHFPHRLSSGEDTSVSGLWTPSGEHLPDEGPDQGAVEGAGASAGDAELDDLDDYDDDEELT